MGGSDQWGNIIAGVDLIRRTHRRAGPRAHLAAADPQPTVEVRQVGRRRGVARPRPRPSPYQFRQYWMQLADDDVERYLLMFSLAPARRDRRAVDRRARRARRSGALAQRALADELTDAGARRRARRDAADEAADVLFGGDPTAASADGARGRGRRGARRPPSAADGARRRRRAARRDRPGQLERATPAGTLDQRGVRVNGTQLVADADRAGRACRLLHGGIVLLRKGKHAYHLVEISPGDDGLTAFDASVDSVATPPSERTNPLRAGTGTNAEMAPTRAVDAVSARASAP